MYEDLILKYRSFDFEGALGELQDWIRSLEDTYEDQIAHNILENVKDLIFENCVFAN